MTSDPQFPPLETQRCQTLAGHTMLDDIGFHHHCMVDPFSLVSLLETTPAHLFV